MGPHKVKKITIAEQDLTLYFMPITNSVHWRAIVPADVVRWWESDTSVDIAVVVADLAKLGDYAAYRVDSHGHSTMTVYATAQQL